jgi:alpha-tubulin suppressor-like RCC1 family protein
VLLNVAIAGNDKVLGMATSFALDHDLFSWPEFTSHGITQYDSLQAFAAKHSAFSESLADIKQIASNQTGFTALSSSGTVYTWGDGRYEACLGREITDEL